VHHEAESLFVAFLVEVFELPLVARAGPARCILQLRDLVPIAGRGQSTAGIAALVRVVLVKSAAEHHHRK